MAQSRLAVARPAVEPEAEEAEGASLGWLEDSIGFHLRAAHDSAAQAFAARARAGASPSHLAVLSLLGANPGISQTALARATRRDISSLTSALDDLCRRGLVVRERLEHDRRTYALALTPAGRKTLKKLFADAEEHERLLDRLLGPDRENFVAALRRIAAGLKQHGAK
jgi:DNA-binding MarR family transcriptional regulator